MWEQLKVYKQLDKKDINPSFKKFGLAVLSHIEGYSIDQTNTLIKIFRVRNQIEQSIFIEKSAGSYDMKVRVCMKPVDFYKRHRFAMVNITLLGEIMNNYRRSSYPLTKEWEYLAYYLAERIKNEINIFLAKYDTYEKIINHRRDIEADDAMATNKYGLLIYAAIRTKNQALLISYIDSKLKTSTVVSLTEYLKPSPNEIDEADFLSRLKILALAVDFNGIENEIKRINSAV